MNVRVLIGSKKGAFVLESDSERRDWRVRGPFCEHWPLTHVAADLADGTIYATGGNAWFGPAVWKSNDVGATWTHSSQGLAYPQGETPVQCAWVAHAAHGRLYVGVEPAGLFVSDDGGGSFREVEGLRRHPSRSNGTGRDRPRAALHRLRSRRRAAPLGRHLLRRRVLHGGRRRDLEPAQFRHALDYLPEGERYPEFGQCVHNLTLAPGQSNRLYQQNHCGMYRSDDGGASWRSIEKGLPSSFGFPVAAHPRDPDKLFFVPLNGDTKGRYPPDARAAVWRSRDGGAHWTEVARGCPVRRLFRRDAAGPGNRCARSRRRLFRHEQRLGLREPRRGGDLGLYHARPAGDFLRRDDDGGLMRAPAVVRLPLLLTTLFPDAERVVRIEAETVEDVINGLEARGRGCATAVRPTRRFAATSTSSSKANGRGSTPRSNPASTSIF